MKPYRGKRMGPHSRPAEFSLSEGCRPGLRGSLGDPPAGCAPPLRPVHFPRGERHDRLVGRQKPPGKVARSFRGAGVTAPGRVGRPGDRGLLLVTRRGGGRPARGVGSTVEDCSQCSATACVSGTGSPPSPPSGSVANRSVSHPTRLETRTKESNMCASHGVLRNLKAQ